MDRGMTEVVWWVGEKCHRAAASRFVASSVAESLGYSVQ